MAERTTMMDQYKRIKAQYRDAIVFFRLGDFYEMFFEDAIEASSLLDLTLTHRQGESMCGVPYHAARSYIARLLRQGKKVAICEQLSEASNTKGLLERRVVEVVTPGTTVEEEYLEQLSNNYILALCTSRSAGRSSLCFAYMDVSTGEFRAFSKTDLNDARSIENLRSELYRLAPRELLIQQSLLDRGGFAEAIEESGVLVVNRYPDWSFDAQNAEREIARRFGLQSLKGRGFEESSPELAAAAALLRYIDETTPGSSPRLSPPLPYREDNYVAIDEGSRKNLEIVRNLSDQGTSYTLFSTLNYTCTAPGARLLRQWLLEPLRDRHKVEERLDAVDFLYRNQGLLNKIRDGLGGIRDIERLASRVAMDKAHAKDLLALAMSIRGCCTVRTIIADSAGEPSTKHDGSAMNTVLRLLAGQVEESRIASALDSAAAIESALIDEPSTLLTEGNLIRDGYDDELDRLRSIKAHSKELLDAYVEEERVATGISTLRVRYNRIIGHYLEVTKGKVESVPKHFIRRQSLVSGERFTTTRLEELESEINGATERIIEIEKRLFLELRERVKKTVEDILALGRAAAVWDCLASFSWAATVRGYSRPKLVDEPVLRIVEGRHPVVEAHLGALSFVPNGIRLDARPDASDGDPAFALITGPNMAGKSTFLRQTALIALMALSGSFVPALDAEIGMIDKIFCRVGAQDNLARGESTFLVEMHETAFILNTASPSSLVIMDEVGRGTSTIDGLAIAWAVSECILDDIGCRALFATHYHELTALSHPRLRNYSMAVLEENEDVVFLKHIEEGPARGSYGIHVAKLAGLPPAVLERARQIQAALVRQEQELPSSRQIAGIKDEIEAKTPPKSKSGRIESGAQELFSSGDLVLAELSSLDINRLSPLEALNTLERLQRKLQS
jgi:DNA mismatch repair protein MutS